MTPQVAEPNYRELLDKVAGEIQQREQSFENVRGETPQERVQFDIDVRRKKEAMLRMLESQAELAARGTDEYEKDPLGTLNKVRGQHRLPPLEELPKGLTGFFSGLTDPAPGDKGSEMVPWYGGAVEFGKLGALGLSIKRLNDGSGTSEDWDKVATFMEKMAFESRDTNWRAKAGRITKEAPGFMLEFLATMGAIPAGKKILKEGAEEVAGKVTESFLKRFTKRLAPTAAATAAMPQRTIPEYQRRRLGEVGIDPQTMQFAHEVPDEHFLTSAAKAFGDTWVENLSETVGPLIRFKVPLVSKGIEFVQKKFPALKGRNPLKIMGFDGILEEMGEERVGAILRSLTGISEEGLGEAIYPGGSQLLAEAVAFGGMGLVGRSPQMAKGALDFALSLTPQGRQALFLGKGSRKSAQNAGVTGPTTQVQRQAAANLGALDFMADVTGEEYEPAVVPEEVIEVAKKLGFERVIGKTGGQVGGFVPRDDPNTVILDVDEPLMPLLAGEALNRLQLLDPQITDELATELGNDLLREAVEGFRATLPSELALDSLFEKEGVLKSEALGHIARNLDLLTRLGQSNPSLFGKVYNAFKGTLESAFGSTKNEQARKIWEIMEQAKARIQGKPSPQAPEPPEPQQQSSPGQAPPSAPWAGAPSGPVAQEVKTREELEAMGGAELMVYAIQQRRLSVFGKSSEEVINEILDQQDPGDGGVGARRKPDKPRGPAGRGPGPIAEQDDTPIPKYVDDLREGSTPIEEDRVVSEPEAPEEEAPQSRPLPKKGFVTTGRAPQKFRQRGEGRYIALDEPFDPESGTVEEVDIDVEPEDIYDPNALIEGTTTDQSEVQRFADLQNSGKSRADSLWEMGYRAEAGYIDDDAPGSPRELVVMFEKAPAEAEQAEEPNIDKHLERVKRLTGTKPKDTDIWEDTSNEPRITTRHKTGKPYRNVLYHTTFSDFFKQFDKSKRGSATHYPQADMGEWFTESKDHANWYAQGNLKGAQVRIQTVTLTNPKVIDLEGVHPVDKMRQSGGKWILEVESEKAEAAGHDGLVLLNYPELKLGTDLGWDTGKTREPRPDEIVTGTQVVVFEPSESVEEARDILEEAHEILKERQAEARKKKKKKPVVKPRKPKTVSEPEAIKQVIKEIQEADQDLIDRIKRGESREDLPDFEEELDSWWDLNYANWSFTGRTIAIAINPKLEKAPKKGQKKKSTKKAKKSTTETREEKEKGEAAKEGRSSVEEASTGKWIDPDKISFDELTVLMKRAGIKRAKSQKESRARVKKLQELYDKWGTVNDELLAGAALDEAFPHSKDLSLGLNRGRRDETNARNLGLALRQKGKVFLVEGAELEQTPEEVEEARAQKVFDQSEQFLVNLYDSNSREIEETLQGHQTYEDVLAEIQRKVGPEQSAEEWLQSGYQFSTAFKGEAEELISDLMDFNVPESYARKVVTVSDSPTQGTVLGDDALSTIGPELMADAITAMMKPENRGAKYKARWASTFIIINPDRFLAPQVVAALNWDGGPGEVVYEQAPVDPRSMQTGDTFTINDMAFTVTRRPGGVVEAEGASTFMYTSVDSPEAEWIPADRGSYDTSGRSSEEVGQQTIGGEVERLSEFEEPSKAPDPISGEDPSFDFGYNIDGQRVTEGGYINEEGKFVREVFDEKDPEDVEGQEKMFDDDDTPGLFAFKGGLKGWKQWKKAGKSVLAAIKLNWKKYVASRRGLDEFIYQLIRSGQFRLSRILDEAAEVATDLEREILKAPKADQAKLRDDINQALRGKRRNLSPEIEKTVRQMRRFVDRLSTALANSGLVTGPLRAVILGNRGVYLTLAYRAFYDKKHAKNLDPAIRNQFERWVRMRINYVNTHTRPASTASRGLRQEYRQGLRLRKVFGANPSAEAIDNFIDDVLHDAKDKQGLVQLMSSNSKIGRQVRHILKRRKNLPEIWQALLGRIDDPSVNFLNTVNHVASLVVNAQVHQLVADAGIQAGLFYKEDYKTPRPKGYEATFKKKGDHSWSPLDGLRMQKDTAWALETLLTANQQIQATGARWALHATFKGYRKVGGVIRWGKTIGSVMTHIRNIVSWTGMLTNAGLAPYIVKARREMLKGIKNDSRKYRSRRIELGVIEQSVGLGDVRGMLGDEANESLEAALGLHFWDKGLTAWGRTKAAMRDAEKLYANEDNYFKTLAWEAEIIRQRWADPKLTRKQAEKIAAKLIRDTTPTYSEIGEAGKYARYFPAAANFPSFSVEIARTWWNNWEEGIKNVMEGRRTGDQKKVAIGTQRIVGAVLATTAAPAISAAMAQLLMGWGDEEMEAFRKFLPPWMQNASIVPISWDPEQKDLIYIDFSYTDPYATLTRPIISILRSGTNWWEGDWDALTAARNIAKETFNPIMDEEMFTSYLMDMLRNKTQTGSKLYDENDTGWGIAGSILWNGARRMAPGTIDQGIKAYLATKKYIEPYGRRYQIDKYSLFYIGGFKPMRLNFPAALTQYSINAKHAFQKMPSDWTKVARQPGKHITPERSAKAWSKMDIKRRRLWNRWKDAIDGAAVIGDMSDRELFQAVHAAGTGKEETRRLIYGRYKPYEPKLEFVSRWARQGTRGGATRKDYYERYRAAKQAYLDKRYGRVQK